MESIIERIKNNRFWTFHGGIHPPEQKQLSNDKPIKTIALPEKLIIPLQQHIGSKGDLLVNVGDHVLKGQQLTDYQHPMTVPVHAPTSGTISAITQHTLAHPSGMSDLAIELTPDGEDKWRTRNIVEDIFALSREDIISKIASAGIAGMGGAGFPTSLKLNIKPVINHLIINAAECEPYISCDDLLIREQSETIATGIAILDHLLLPEHILIGIEDNKPKAIEALKNATKHNEKIHVCAVPTKYPSGGEKQLIQILTGKEVKSGTLPIDQGIVSHNVGTVFSIAEAVCHDIPLIRRVVTVTGQNIEKPQNVWALLGTPVSHLLDSCGFKKEDKQKVIMGGPMMGFTLPSINIPIIKTTNCILAPSTKEIPADQTEMECIRCGECADVCPSSLLPQELQWHAKAKNYDELEKLNLFDCIDCGACAYVCPSHIPLVQYYRVAKAEIREQKAQEIKADRAKVRFEARKQRLEKERLAREEKHKLAAAARKAKMEEKTDAGTTAKSAVAAALARVQAKKQAQQTPEDDNKSAVSAAIERAKAKKLARQQAAASEQMPANAPESGDELVGDAPVEDKKAMAKQRAIEKAKARKLAKETQLNSSDDATESASPKAAEAVAEKKPENSVTTADDKKAAAKQRAIEKAKARKLAKETQLSSSDVSSDDATESASNQVAETVAEQAPENSVTTADDKKAAAKQRAIEKAKARKLAKETQLKSSDVSSDDATESASNQASEAVDEQATENSAITADDEKLSRKDRIKTRVAQLQENSAQVQTTEDIPTKSDNKDDKKAKIAAAIAKAKKQPSN